MLQYQHPATDINHTRPALSTLASIASDHSSHLRTYNNGNHIMMTYATSSPAATTGAGQGNISIPPVCQNCATSTTPLWRRDELGSVLCNACGLFLKLHGTPRPISLKTDVIKSRHRVKTASQALKKRSLFEGNDISALTARTEAGTPPSNHPNNLRRPSQKTSSRGSERSYSPVSRSDTPSIRHPSNNIAPQHLFDAISMPPEHSFQPSPSIPPLNLRQPSPSSLEPPQTYDGLLQSATALKTRVSELEVINDLFRGRVAQLEQAEENSRRNELMQQQAEKNLRQLLEESQVREIDLQRRISDLQRELVDFRGGTSSGSSGGGVGGGVGGGGGGGGGGGVGGEEQQQSRSAKRQRMSSDDYNNNSNKSSNNNAMLPRGMSSLVDIAGVGGGLSSSTPSPSMYSSNAASNGGMQRQRLSSDGNEYGGGGVPDGHHGYGHHHHLPRVSDGSEYNNLPVISTA